MNAEVDFQFMKKSFIDSHDVALTFMKFDQLYYLPDDLIVKMERSSKYIINSI